MSLQKLSTFSFKKCYLLIEKSVELYWGGRHFEPFFSHLAFREHGSKFFRLTGHGKIALSVFRRNYLSFCFVRYGSRFLSNLPPGSGFLSNLPPWSGFLQICRTNQGSFQIYNLDPVFFQIYLPDQGSFKFAALIRVPFKFTTWTRFSFKFTVWIRIPFKFTAMIKGTNLPPGSGR